MNQDLKQLAQLHDENIELKKEIERLKGERDFSVYDVKNKLPNIEHGSFLVYAPKSFPKNSRWLVAEYYDDVKGFYSESSEQFLDDVTHYCELPEPPKNRL